MKKLDIFLNENINLNDFRFFIDKTITSEGTVYKTINICSRNIESDDTILDLEDKICEYIIKNKIFKYTISTNFYEDSEEYKASLITSNIPSFDSNIFFPICEIKICDYSKPIKEMELAA